VRLAKRKMALLGLAACALLVVGSLSGCTTTQDTAAHKQARAKRILEAREKRQRRHHPNNDGRDMR
jgi:cytochrome c biogenesis protein ResB